MKKLLSSIVLAWLFLASCKKNDLSPGLQNKDLTNSEVSNNISVNVSENVRNIPIDAIFYNECCNEAVYVAGMAHFVNTNNIQHVEVNNITGIGLSTGFSYVSLSPSVLTNVFYSNQIVGIFNFILNMKNNNGCSFRLKATFQSHVNANGDITVSFENADTFCH